MATSNTKKNTLTLPIRALAVPALVAGLRCVTSVNSFKLDTALARNVRDLQEERRKRPSVMDQSLLFGNPDPGPDALEVFDDYRPGSRLQGFANDPARHVPEQPFNRSLLFARQPFQEPSLVSALVPCGLKSAALCESSLSNVFDNSAFENLACAGRGYTNDPGIDANARIALIVWNVLCDDQMQIPDSTFETDRGRWLDFPAPIEISPVVIGENQIDSGSAVKSGQRSVLLIEIDSQRASVVSHGRCLFPTMALFFISLVCFSDYNASRTNEIGRKLRYLSHIAISDVMKRGRIKDFPLEGDVRSVIECDLIGFLRFGKRQRGLYGDSKFYLQSDSRLHMSNIYHLERRRCKTGLRYAKPSRNADFLRLLRKQQSPSAKLMIVGSSCGASTS
jgi:hypothetical protein